MAAGVTEIVEELESRPLRRPRRARWIALAVAVVGVGLIAVLATRESATQRIADSPLVGQRAPALAASTVDGDRVDIADMRGKWVLVNYFATWCVPCRKEHPDLIRFHERHQAQGDLEVIGVVYSDDFAAVRKYRKENGGTWPMAKDPSGRIALDWGVSGVPESFLVDPSGVVVARIVGGVTDAKLEEVLTEARRS